ncbi:MAG: c-type cytochrome [Aureliella sp.]
MCRTTSATYALILVYVAAVSQPLFAQSVPAIDSTNRDYSTELPRLPPMAPKEALDTFDIAEGFELELVASEPLVADPIAVCFDSRERMFVVEMRDYSEQAEESLGKIALLEDTDRDGLMDKRTEFAGGLSWPTAIWCWRNGVIVAHPPYLSWLGDRDGDNKAEIREDWFVGFGRSNVQGLVNSLRWSPRGYIVGATSSAAAKLEATDPKTAKQSLVLRGRDFAIDPLNKTISPRTGGGQHGLFLNAFGDKFVTSNSDHLQQVVEFETWLTTRQTNIPMPRSRRSIAEDGPQAEVFRTSPVEPWRVVRTRLRTKGIVPGPVEGGGRAAGYFTGATGTYIVHHEADFGIEGHDTALVCDVGSNLIHRKQLVDQGLYWSGRRIDAASELVRSRDTWFRPVQLTDGPDGAVYIADMYREVIEHPKSLPPVIKQHLDLTSGRDRGRIYRLRRRDTHAPEPSPLLANITAAQWVSELTSPISWRRSMASQLLLQWCHDNRDSAQIASILELTRTLATRPLPAQSKSTAEVAGRILAMHLLARNGYFDRSVATEVLLANRHPRCVEHILELLTTLQLLDPTRVSDASKPEDARESADAGRLEQLLTGLELPDSRMQLAMCKLASTAAPQLRDKLAGRVITASQQTGINEPLVTWALAEVAPELVSHNIVSRESNMPPHVQQQLAWLMPTWPMMLQRSNTFRSQVRQRLTTRETPTYTTWIHTLLSLSSKQRDAILDSIGGNIRSVLVANATASLEREPFSTADALQLQLVADDFFAAWIEKHLNSSLSGEVALTVAQGLSSRPTARRTRLLVEQMPQMTPNVRSELLRQIANRPDLIPELVAGLESGKISRTWIPVDLQRQIILGASDEASKTLTSIFKQASSDRAAVIQAYADMETRRPTADDLRRGSEVFTQSCSQCHRIGSVGADVGPPLKQLGSKAPRELLETILDPNREVDPKYLGYQVLLDDGRAFAGIVTDESADQLTLRQSGGKTVTVLRQDIDMLKSTDQSLMPEGLEQQISPSQMQSLIHYLRQAAR